MYPSLHKMVPPGRIIILVLRFTLQHIVRFCWLNTTVLIKKYKQVTDTSLSASTGVVTDVINTSHLWCLQTKRQQHTQQAQCNKRHHWATRRWINQLITSPSETNGTTGQTGDELSNFGKHENRYLGPSNLILLYVRSLTARSEFSSLKTVVL